MSEERKLTRAFSLLSNLPVSNVTPPNKSPLIYSRAMSSSSGIGSSGYQGVSLSSSSSFTTPTAFRFENTSFRLSIIAKYYFSVAYQIINVF